MAGTTVVRKRGTKPAAKAAPAEKAPAKAKRGVATELTAAEERASRDAALTKDIIRLKKAGSNWKDISDEVGVTQGRAIFLYDAATVSDDEMIAFRSDAELGKKLLKLRAEGGMSWGKIAARTGYAEGKLKKLHADAGGGAGTRIGRGGRVAGSEATKKPVVRQRAKAAAPAEKAKPVVRTRLKKKAA